MSSPSNRNFSVRKHLDEVAFCSIALIVAVMITSAFFVRRADPAAMITVRMAGDSPFFDEPEVVREFAKNGIQIQQSSFGSRQVAELPLQAQYRLDKFPA